VYSNFEKKIIKFINFNIRLLLSFTFVQKFPKFFRIVFTQVCIFATSGQKTLGIFNVKEKNKNSTFKKENNLGLI
jgi:hypothetical protein